MTFSPLPPRKLLGRDDLKMLHTWLVIAAP